MALIGGGVIKDYEFTQAWGVNPANAAGTVVLDVVGGGSGEFDLEAGDYVVYQFGLLASFYGIVTEITEVEGDGGSFWRFTVLDNRVRLGWQTVTGAWNMPDDRSTAEVARPPAPTVRLNNDGSDPGGSSDVDFSAVPVAIGSSEGVGALVDPGEEPEKRRWFWHILPEHAAAGIRTWTQGPLNARQILNSAFGGAWGDYAFVRNYHAAMGSVYPLGLDFTDGVKMNSVLAQVCDACGMDVRLSGARTLYFERKGEGLLPVIPEDHAEPRQAGTSLTANDTAVMVIGDENLVQTLNIALEPDWKRAWEAFIDEVAWLREVATVFSLPTATKANRAELAARAREVTVAQYVAAKDDSSFADYRPFGRISRMALPAWVYIRELVFRSYRIPRTYAFGGVPLGSLKFGDRLLCATEVSGTGPSAAQRYRRNPKAFYPDARAEAIVRGQPLDLADGRSIHLFMTRRERNLRNEWTPMADFDLDEENYAIRFRVPVFLDGDPAAGKGLYLRVNAGEGGETDHSGDVGADSDYLDVVVPNPGYEISPANVKLSVTWRLGKYRSAHGSGARYGTMKVPGLAIHALDIGTDGGFSDSGLVAVEAEELFVPGALSLLELKFSDGGVASDKAEAAAESMTMLEALQASGSYTRRGQCGTQLTPTIDRVTLKIDDNGVSETVDFTKARATRAFVAEKTLVRMQRAGELFPGQQSLRNEVLSLRLESRLQAGGPAGGTSRKGTHGSLPEVTSRPVGAEYQDTATVFGSTVQAPVGGWKAGHLVWLDDEGKPSKTGKAFGGVVAVTPTPAGEEVILQVARRGVVPVRCEPGIAGGADVFADVGGAVAAAAGEKCVGRLCHHGDTPGSEGQTALGMVRLGGGGATEDSFCPFGEIMTWQAGEPPETKTGIRGGVIHCGDQNWNIEPHEIDLATAGVWLVHLDVACEVNRDDDGELLLPEVKTGTKPTAWTLTAWSEGVDYPENTNPEASDGLGEVVLPIGRLTVTGGAATLEPAGCGGFSVTHCAGTLGYERF